VVPRARRWTVPFLADDDSGRLFHPYGGRVRSDAGTQATCGVLFGSTHASSIPRPWLTEPPGERGRVRSRCGQPALIFRSQLFTDAVLRPKATEWPSVATLTGVGNEIQVIVRFGTSEYDLNRLMLPA